MRTFKYRPHPLLRPYIDRFWSWEADSDERVVLPVLLPGTGAEVFFHHATPFQQAGDNEAFAGLGQSHLLCLRRRALPLAPLRGLGFIAVRFRAGHLGHLIDPPVAQCLDQALPVDALWGLAGRDLAERVASAADFPARCLHLERFFLQRLEKCRADSLIASAVDQLYRRPHATSVATLADNLELGRRQLERRFRAQEGLSPAAFRRRIRFQKTVRALLLDPELAMLDAALDQGYYDQSHFHRDFRDITGRVLSSHLAAARGVTHFYNTPQT